MKILFIHGLASSGAYKTADSLRILFKPCDVIAPDVPIDPAEALALLRNICLREAPDLIVGLSLGGFWAQKLRGYRKVLINPDLHPSRLMRTMIGEVKYLSPRKDGAQSFLLTEAICDAYEALEAVQFDGLDAAADGAPDAEGGTGSIQGGTLNAAAGDTGSLPGGTLNAAAGDTGRLPGDERLLTQGFFADADELVHCGDEFSVHYPGRAVIYKGGHLPNIKELRNISSAMEVAKYIYVDDAAQVERIKKGIEIKKQRFGKGYCPCVTPLAHNDDTVCPCKEYRETGHCHCGMYKE